MAILGLAGYSKSGKDTVAQMIQELQPDKNWQIKKFSGKLKQMASLITKVPAEKFEEQEFKQNAAVRIYTGKIEDVTIIGYQAREFLQFLGTECVRDLLGEDVWVNALMNDYDDSQNWIVTDVRFPNEADAIRTFGHIIRIDRGKAVNVHPSETALRHYIFDDIVDNTSDLEDLRTEVTYMLKHL